MKKQIIALSLATLVSVSVSANSVFPGEPSNNTHEETTTEVDMNTEYSIQELDESGLFVSNGRIYGDETMKIYNRYGRDVTELNGNLNGVYTVKFEGKTMKVVVK